MTSSHCETDRRIWASDYAHKLVKKHNYFEVHLQTFSLICTQVSSNSFYVYNTKNNQFCYSDPIAIGKMILAYLNNVPSPSGEYVLDVIYNSLSKRERKVTLQKYGYYSMKNLALPAPH